MFDKRLVFPDELHFRKRVSNVGESHRGMEMFSPQAAIKLWMSRPRDWQREPNSPRFPGEMVTAGIDWYIRILEQGSRGHREKSRSQLCWSVSDFLRGLLASYWIWFLLRFIFSLRRLFSWLVTSESIYLMKEHFLFCSPLKFPIPPPCANGRLRALANYTSKIKKNTGTFKRLQNGKPKVAYWIGLSRFTAC